VRLLSTNRPPKSVKSPVHSPNELWNTFGACGGLLGAKCHSRLPTSSNSLKPQDEPPRLGRWMFLWASYVVGQDINKVWWSTDMVSGYKRGPERRKNSTCTSNSQQMAQYEPPAPPICLRGALKGCLGVHDLRVDSHPVGRFDQKLAVQRLFPLTEQLKKSQLPQAQAQHLVTRRLVPYIAHDGQWQCGIRPTAP
jgi:hypothetical protein